MPAGVAQARTDRVPACGPRAYSIHIPLATRA